jgi:hypothetical protein
MTNAWDKLSPANLANWRAAYDRWAERDAKEWAASPNNPSIADHMYGQGPKLIPDSQRGCVSKLGGVAQPAKGKR